MSNLLTRFVSRLTQVTHSIAKNGDHVYTAAFEDGGSHVIRRSGRVYLSVAQCREYQNRGGNTEFLFSAKPTPSLLRGQRNRHIVTLQIQERN
jgi:hypothetical protein